MKYIIYNYPLKREVNSGGYTETQKVEVYIYLALFTDPEAGDSCFSQYLTNQSDKKEKSKLM